MHLPHDHQDYIRFMGGDINHFKIISKLHNKGGGDDPRGTHLTCYLMHLIMTIKIIYGLMVGIFMIFKRMFKLYNDGGWGC